MFQACAVALSLLCATAGLAASRAEAAPPPLSAYGALPSISGVTLSADGRRLAFISMVGDDRRLVLQSVSGELLATIALGKTNIEDLVWAGPDDIVILASVVSALPEFGNRKHVFWTVQSYSLSKKRLLQVSSKVPNAVGGVFDRPSVRVIDGEGYAFVRVITVNPSPRFDLARVSVKDGSVSIVDWSPMDGRGWLIDAKGRAVGRARYNEVKGNWSAAVRQGALWPDVFTTQAPLDSPYLAGLSREDDGLVVVVPGEDGVQYAKVGYDGSIAAALPDDKPLSNLIVDPTSSRVIGAINVGDSSEYRFFDPVAKAAWASVVKSFPKSRVYLTSWTPDWKTVAVLVEGSGNAGVHYLVDLAGKKADIIGDAYPKIPPEAVADIRTYSYKAADGLDIPGYLTLPPGREAKALPLIVLPHGGPAARDVLAFDYQAQALASRGYAVLQPNFRGSSGYTPAFKAAGYGEWGRKMQTDLSDGVRALANEGIVDPKRVCIVGWSYGGYAAMAGVTLDPGVYRCAVAGAGVSDLKRFLSWRAGRSGDSSETVRTWNRFWASSDENDPKLEAISPARQAARADAPILLIHGKNDTVVPYEQTTLLANALKKAGKPVEVVTLEGEDHSLSKAVTRQQSLEATIAFLLKHNPPD